jgi:hypothetical protein
VLLLVVLLCVIVLIKEIGGLTSLHRSVYLPPAPLATIALLSAMALKMAVLCSLYAVALGWKDRNKGNGAANVVKFPSS